MTKRTPSPFDVIMRQPDGCHLHPHCLACPRPQCYFDEEPEPESVADLSQHGSTVNEIAAQLGITRRSVFRRRARERAL